MCHAPNVAQMQSSQKNMEMIFVIVKNAENHFVQTVGKHLVKLIQMMIGHVMIVFKIYLKII